MATASGNVATPSRQRSSSRATPDPDEMTYDMLVTDFMMEVASSNPNLMQEFPKIFTTNATLEEMFKFVWNLQEAMNTLTPTLSVSRKTTKAAYKYWLKGNAFMKCCDRDRALKCYNKSLMEAPHTVIVVDGKQWGQEPDDILYSTSVSSSTDTKDPYREDGWGNYTALSHAYEARAHVLFSLKQYQKCVDDIDRVLYLGCPLPIADKMRDVRAECARLGPHDVKQTERWGTDNSVSFLFKSPESPTLEDPNPSYPSFSNSTSFAFDEEYGRHMVANRDIEPGELVSVERAYSSTLFPKYFWDYCTICLRRTSNPLPCPNCSKVIFCSEECRRCGLGECHKVECPIIATLSRLNMSNNAVLAIRMFAEMGYLKMKSMVLSVQEDAIQKNPQARGLDDSGMYSSANYRTVYNLLTNRKKRPVHDLLKRTMEAFVLLKLLILSEEYYVDKSGRKIDVADDDLLFTGAMLMHHMMIFWCNADSIGEIQHEEAESPNSPVVAYGTGIFQSTSLLNHACYSTCASVSYARVQVMTACRHIPAGTQITRQYANLYHKTLAEREAVLKGRYHFVCHCEACVGNWPQSLPSTFINDLKCVVCKKPVLQKDKKCFECNITYNRSGPLDERPAVITYDYSVVRKEVDDALKDYMLSLPRFTQGIDTEDDVRVIKNLMDLYDTYVALPTHGHIVAQSLLHAVRLRRGTSAFVKEDAWQDV